MVLPMRVRQQIFMTSRQMNGGDDDESARHMEAIKMICRRADREKEAKRKGKIARVP